MYATPKQFLYPSRYEMRKDLGGGRAQSRDIAPFFHLGFDQIHYRHRQPVKAVQFCRIDRKGGDWHANHGGLYDSLFYPMAKTVTARLAKVPRGRARDDWKYIWLLFPVIVISGDLFVLDSTKAHPVPEPQDWISFSRELESGKLSGSYALDFVREDRLEKFVHECINPLSELAKELVEHRTEFLLQGQLPWQD
jgi:hypothetical protein